MSSRIFILFLLITPFTVLLGYVRLAAAEPGFDYKGLPGHMTIEQAKKHVEETLTCETDADVPMLVRCDCHSTTYLGKPAMLKLEFIDGHLAQLRVMIPAEHFPEMRRTVLGQYGKPHWDGMETDGPKPYSHMEFTLADGELIVDEWVAHFNLPDPRFAYVSAMKFLPSALDKRRAEVVWLRRRAMEDRDNSNM
jgi:hypothetical protein